MRSTIKIALRMPSRVMRKIQNETSVSPLV